MTFLPKWIGLLELDRAPAGAEPAAGHRGCRTANRLGLWSRLRAGI